MTVFDHAITDTVTCCYVCTWYNDPPPPGHGDRTTRTTHIHEFIGCFYHGVRFLSVSPQNSFTPLNYITWTRNTIINPVYASVFTLVSLTYVPFVIIFVMRDVVAVMSSACYQRVAATIVGHGGGSGFYTTQQLLEGVSIWQIPEHYICDIHPLQTRRVYELTHTYDNYCQE